MKKIKLTKGKYALVDDWNFEWLNQWKWCYNCGYAVRWEKIGKGTRGNQNRKRIFMHRLIMNTPKGKETDHKDMNRCNNQEYNLRVATPTENKRNRVGIKNTSSKYKGVSWYKPNKKWRAYIYSEGKTIPLGYFTCEEDAAKSYDRKAKELHGEFVLLNKI